MQVQVILRGNLARYATNTRGAVLLNLPEGSCIAEILNLLGVPEGQIYLLLRNRQRALSFDKLCDGDEIELVPPIAGG